MALPKSLSAFLVFALLSVLMVLFRMRAIEIDYEIDKVGQRILKEQLENKELNANKAKLLSTERLMQLAKDNGLDKAQQHQIIVIE
jgi:cell division protein FtsL